MEDPSRYGRKVRPAVLAVALTLTIVLTACTAPAPPAPTARVDRGTVATTVSASGQLVSITATNLGFPEGGKVAELLVKVGDRVQAGQVLARLDDYVARQMLAQQQAQLAQQVAMLGKVRNSTTVDGAQATLAQAQQILDATEDQVDATNSANASAVDRAEAELSFAKKQLDDAEDALQRCETTAPAPAPAPGALPLSDPAPTTPPPNCMAQESAVESAQSTVVTRKTALDAAENKQQVDAAAGEVSIENAQQNVVNAQNQLNAASTDRPFDVAAQAAQVRNLQAGVAIAQRDVDNTVLIAPVAGVVSAINGSVGEFVGPTSLATPLAPGTDARIPGVGAVPGGGGGGAGGDGSGGAGAGGSGAPGAGAFLVLNDVQTFQVVVPFQEADAARVAPNQRVNVTFDAIPDLTRPGSVLAIAPAGADEAGIINYYTTVVLSESDPRLRDGQTADAGVIVQSVENVLRVPNAAVSRENGRSVVTVRQDGQQVTVPFEPGLVGDTHTEVLSGLREGQELLLPSAQVQPGATRGPPR